uniref:Uncharacterized protein n=1 Tax=Arundo donax TaxID=35708 RepID=A0A0A9FZC7_ARUDO
MQNSPLTFQCANSWFIISLARSTYASQAKHFSCQSIPWIQNPSTAIMTHADQTVQENTAAS